MFIQIFPLMKSTLINLIYLYIGLQMIIFNECLRILVRLSRFRNVLQWNRIWINIFIHLHIFIKNVMVILFTTFSSFKFFTRLLINLMNFYFLKILFIQIFNFVALRSALLSIFLFFLFFSIIILLINFI